VGPQHPPPPSPSTNLPSTANEAAAAARAVPPVAPMTAITNHAVEAAAYPHRHRVEGREGRTGGELRGCQARSVTWVPDSRHSAGAM